MPAGKKIGGLSIGRHLPQLFDFSAEMSTQSQ
jgi:hypothetical protein